MMFKHLEPPNIPEITDKTLPSGKRFYYTPDGIALPSITTILGHKEKPWLKNWQNMLGKDKAVKEQKRCADRGTAVHELNEKYLNNEEIDRTLYDPKHLSRFNQLKVRLNKINNIRAQEIALFSKTLGVAGRVDCIAEYESALSVIDFKTSNNNKSKDMIEDYFLQCTAYSLMWEELTGEKIDNIVIIMAVERGIVPLVFKETTDKYKKQLVKRILSYHGEQNGK